MKTAKPKIVDPCELGDTHNVFLTSEMVCDYNRGNFKAVISPPVFMKNSVDLMNHSEAQKKMVETFNSQDKELLVLEDVSEDGYSLILQNVRVSNKAIEKEEITEGVREQNGVVINLSSIWSHLLQDDKDLNSKLTTSPPMLTMDSSSAMNHSDFHASEVKDEIFNTQEREFLSVLENLMDIDDPLHSQNKNVNVKVTTEGLISGYFCSDTVFNLSHRVITETEIKALDKGLDYVPIQKKINEPELRKDFSEFCRRLRNKWYFRNETTPQFSEVP